MTETHNDRLLHVRDLGLVEYDEAWTFQRQAAEARIEGKRHGIGDGRLVQDLLIVCEHPAVVTLGRSTKAANVLITPEQLALRDVQLREVERGGDVTVHEPGQLVVYPIIDLERHKRDLHWYLRQVEESIIVALRALGLDTMRAAGLTGVWIDGRKLASIGVHARDWVTWHGVALNVNNDLATFAHIVPCGIDGVEMTTVSREFRRFGKPAPAMPAVRVAVIDAFAQTFDLQLLPL